MQHTYNVDSQREEKRVHSVQYLRLDFEHCSYNFLYQYFPRQRSIEIRQKMQTHACLPPQNLGSNLWPSNISHLQNI